MAEEGSLPPGMAAVMRLLSSEPFCLLLSHVTGLDLAQNVIRLDAADSGDCKEPCSSSSLANGREDCRGNDHTVGI